MLPRLSRTARNALLPLAARRVNRPAAGDVNTVLIVQPDHLGDILLSQPAVNFLRAANPDARLIAVVGPWSAEITRLAWPVDEIVTLPFPGFERASSGLLLDPYRMLSVETRRLRRYSAGRAYVLRPDAWWAAWLAFQSVSGPVTTSDDKRLRSFATDTVSVRQIDHAAERALAIASGVADQSNQRGLERRLELLPTDAVIKSREMLENAGVRGSYIVAHPGAGAPVKHWPVHHWIALLDRLPGCQVVLTGSAAERPLCDQIAAHVDRAVNLAGRTDVATLAELLRAADLVIGADNGPLHLAVAVGTPTVHLFGPSDPRRYGPLGDPRSHRVVTAAWDCPACGDLSLSRGEGCGCMLAISVDTVARAVREMRADHA